MIKHHTLKSTLLALACSTMIGAVQAADTIKVGVLH